LEKLPRVRDRNSASLSFLGTKLPSSAWVRELLRSTSRAGTRVSATVTAARTPKLEYRPNCWMGVTVVKALEMNPARVVRAARMMGMRTFDNANRTTFARPSLVGDSPVCAVSS